MQQVLILSSEEKQKLLNLLSKVPSAGIMEANDLVLIFGKINSGTVSLEEFKKSLEGKPKK